MQELESIIKIAQSFSPIGVIAILAIIIFRLVVDKLSIGSILGLGKKVSQVQEVKYPELENHYNEMKILTAQNKNYSKIISSMKSPDMVRDLSEIKGMIGEQGQRLTRVETLVEVLRENNYMANIQYYTTVDWDLNIKDVGTDENGYAINATAITSGAPANTAKKWIAGAFVQNEVDGKLYKNAGSTASPNFVEVGAGGGGTPAGSDTYVQYNDAGSFGADSTFTRDPATKETSIGATLTGGIITSYSLSNNFLGFGLTGAGQVFDTGSGGINVLASLDTTSFGVGPNTTIVGYITLGPGANSNAQYNYNVISDESQIQIQTRNLAGKQAEIRLKSNPSNPSLGFYFNGSNSYQFPITSPTPGTTLGYVSANQLGWVASGLTIGNAISSSTANRVLFADGSNNLAQSSKFTFDNSTNAFSVGAGNTLTVDDTNGVVATTATSVPALSAVTSYGTAFKVFTAGGMGQLIQMGDVSQTNYLTLFSVADVASPQITAVLDGEFAVYRATGTSAKALLVKTDNLGTGQLLVELGDINGVVNSTKLSLDDSSKTIKFTGSEYQNSTVEIDSAVSTTYTVQDGDRIIYVNTNTAGVTVTLPSVVSDNKRLVKIKCTGTNAVTIVASAGSVDTGSLATGEVGEWQALNSTITWQRVQ